MSTPQTLLPLLAQIGLLPLGDGEVHPDRPITQGGPEEQFADVVRVVSARTVIEVGSWQGRSAIAWGAALAEAGDDWLVMCVDTWLGSVEMWESPTGEWSREGLFINDGMPSVFRTFTSNIRRTGYGDHVIAVPMDSAQGLELLSRRGVVADIIYVDAAHDFANALRDIRQSLKLLNPQNPRSLVLCDDFMRQWAGVREAVFASAHETGSQILLKDTQAALVPATAGAPMVDELLALGWKEVSIEPDIDSVESDDTSVARLTRELRDVYGIVMRANLLLRAKRQEVRELKANRRALQQRFRATLASSPDEKQRLRTELRSVRAELTSVRAELAAVLNSRTWRMTAWVRRIRSIATARSRRSPTVSDSLE